MMKVMRMSKGADEGDEDFILVKRKDLEEILKGLKELKGEVESLKGEIASAQARQS